MKFFITVITVEFIETEYNVSEGAGVMTVGITLNRPSPQRIVLQLEITPNTAQGNVLLVMYKIIVGRLLPISCWIYKENLINLYIHYGIACIIFNGKYSCRF